MLRLKCLGGQIIYPKCPSSFFLGDNFHQFGAPMPLEVTTPSHLDSLGLTIIVTALKGLWTHAFHGFNLWVFLQGAPTNYNPHKWPCKMGNWGYHPYEWSCNPTVLMTSRGPLCTDSQLPNNSFLKKSQDIFGLKSVKQKHRAHKKGKFWVAGQLL